MRVFRSFSRQRWISVTTCGGVSAGSADQSGVDFTTAAISSVTSSPSNARRAGEHLVEHGAERPDVGALVDRLSARLFG